MSELNIAIYESARNKASDDYFEARPQITRSTHNLKLFEAGFERAWQASRAKALSEAQKEIDELKSEIACYEKYGLPHNPNGN